MGIWLSYSVSSLWDCMPLHSTFFVQLCSHPNNPLIANYPNYTSLFIITIFFFRYHKLTNVLLRRILSRKSMSMSNVEERRMNLKKTMWSLKKSDRRWVDKWHLSRHWLRPFLRPLLATTLPLPKWPCHLLPRPPKPIQKPCPLSLSNHCQPRLLLPSNHYQPHPLRDAQIQ